MVESHINEMNNTNTPKTRHQHPLMSPFISFLFPHSPSTIHPWHPPTPSPPLFLSLNPSMISFRSFLSHPLPSSSPHIHPTAHHPYLPSPLPPSPPSIRSGQDFGDYLPGHGGVLDRLDCQMVMHMFVSFSSTLLRMWFVPVCTEYFVWDIWIS